MRRTGLAQLGSKVSCEPKLALIVERFSRLCPSDEQTGSYVQRPSNRLVCIYEIGIGSNFLAYLSPWCSISSAHTPLLNRPRPAPIGTNYPDPRSSATRCCVEDLAVVH
jgi:hypothetical protein